MDSITSDMDRVDTSTMVNIFIGLGLKPEDLVHPYATVDLLIGVNYASMHHYRYAVPRVDGEMRLLRSNFGTGWVLEGYHPQISLSPGLRKPARLSQSVFRADKDEKDQHREHSSTNLRLP